MAALAPGVRVPGRGRNLLRGGPERGLDDGDYRQGARHARARSGSPTRIPDGHISAHANMCRIGAVSMDNPTTGSARPDMIDFAVEKGYYDPDLGQSLSATARHHPLNPVSMRVCMTRIWSIYRRSAPSLTFGNDYHRGVEGSKELPLFIKPDEKLSVRDVMGLMREHLEGTPYDMTQGSTRGRSPVPTAGAT